MFSALLKSPLRSAPRLSLLPALSHTRSVRTMAATPQFVRLSLSLTYLFIQDGIERRSVQAACRARSCRAEHHRQRDMASIHRARAHRFRGPPPPSLPSTLSYLAPIIESDKSSCDGSHRIYPHQQILRRSTWRSILWRQRMDRRARDTYSTACAQGF